MNVLKIIFIHILIPATLVLLIISGASYVIINDLSNNIIIKR